jgi:hypothetical protein
MSVKQLSTFTPSNKVYNQKPLQAKVEMQFSSPALDGNTIPLMQILINQNMLGQQSKINSCTSVVKSSTQTINTKSESVNYNKNMINNILCPKVIRPSQSNPSY